ncbi:ADP-ribose pyrophosphatase YjhB (NUDIX family) [Kribbella antiqua]|uniref:ADP-ribose pyrophosphatase YjhB (NUDIX family) n=1 Tax=Kribbella antiqua TaxID=2512217 RepID=A0A4R2J2U8_9ACTN|nr:NUDIX domain-containing protein [Kribbella antiqua]TCO52037.1 ADP-ribose pyrophosphatase YjhB (NUDIX family) [Kribbella antiqua]
MNDVSPRVPGYTRHEYGDRIGATAKLRVGATAAVLDGDRLLLTRRSDNGEWCFPGGGIDPGERPAETAEREVFEETGLSVRVTGLLGVYSDPDVVVAYPDGNRVQILGILFRAEAVDGSAGCSAEVSEVGWFTAEEASRLTVIANHRRLLPSAFGDATPYFDRPST